MLPMLRNTGLRRTVGFRQFHSALTCFQNNANEGGSLFGQVSQFKEEKGSMLEQMSQRVEQVDETTKESKAVSSREFRSNVNKQFISDPEIVELQPKAVTAVEKLLSPLKQQLYNKMIETHGRYLKDQVVQLENGKNYKLSLSKEELQVLEPSVYAESYRIKSSYKKTYPFLRMLREMELNKAITQCHFSAKKVSREVGAMLERAVDQAKDLGLDPNELYIEQIWVGKDGGEPRRIDFKGRGRMGIITHKYVHVKAILRRNSYKQAKEAAKVEKVDHRKVWYQLASRGVKEYPQTQEYKW